MRTNRIARSTGTSRLTGRAVMRPLLGQGWRDERSMRALEILVAAAALAGVSVAIVAQPAVDRPEGVVRVVVVAAVLVVTAVVSLLRSLA